MKKILAAIVAVFAISGTAHAADDKAQRVFKPSGAWQADFGEDYCRLARIFSDGNDEISIAMERIQPGNRLRVILVGDGIKLYRRATEMGYRFLPSGDDRKAQLLRSETGDGHQYLNLGYVLIGPTPQMPAPGSQPAPPPPYSREAELDYANGIDGVLLGEGLVDSIRIETGGLKAPVEVVQTCIDDLLTYWGLDAEKHRTLTRPVIPASDMSKWLPTGTIPFSEFGKLSGGANAIRLMIDTAGKPTSCKVHWASLDASLNDKICKDLMENAKFQPALDAGGQPVASYWTTETVFLLGPPPGRRR